MTEEAETVLEMLREAELVGGWKALSWLSLEFHTGMAIRDIMETINYAQAILSEELWNIFNQKHCIITHLKDRIKKRTKIKLSNP